MWTPLAEANNYEIFYSFDSPANWRNLNAYEDIVIGAPDSDGKIKVTLSDLLLG